VRARPTAALFVLLALAAALATAASATTVRLGNLVITIDGTVTPQKLSKTTPTPITLKLEGSIATTDQTHVPALKTLSLQFDKHGHLYTKGLATCSVAKLRSTVTARAKAVCGDALVGTGRASAEIAFPEQAPFSASGPMLIFNGVPKGGNPVLIIHVYAHVPAPTTFVTEGVIERTKGKYATQTTIAIPTITGGQGSLTSFEATLHKTWTYKGKVRSLLLASCPTGSLFAHGEFDFADGTRVSGEVAKSCVPG
jgi:hypothetical protein